MAKFSATTLVCSMLLFLSMVFAQDYSNITLLNLKPQEKWLKARKFPGEKVTIVRFYVQDALIGPNATVYEVARATITATSPTLFGQTVVYDDAITVGADPNSMEIGRCQGIIASGDLRVLGYSQISIYAFTAGKYNGSSITIVGRNPFTDETRELPVTGGTGVFRMSRGLSISRNILFNPGNYSIIEHNILITYYPN